MLGQRGHEYAQQELLVAGGNRGRCLHLGSVRIPALRNCIVIRLPKIRVHWLRTVALPGRRLFTRSSWGVEHANQRAESRAPRVDRQQPASSYSTMAPGHPMGGETTSTLHGDFAGEATSCLRRFLTRPSGHRTHRLPVASLYVLDLPSNLEDTW